MAVAVAVWQSGSFDSGSGRVAVGVGGMDWGWQCGHFGTKYVVYCGCLAAWQWQWQFDTVAVLTAAVAGWQWEGDGWIGGGSAVILVPNMLCIVAVWQWQWQFGAVAVAQWYCHTVTLPPLPPLPH
jgi:hypothetical protein